ncbi:MAG: hypothetical protein KJ072_27380 [Verrucomicrobia bacterium]|nr:hypothetical protein [Verrucomicrobiota bacterium]
MDVPVGPVTLTAGKQKEPFVFEMVGLMPQLPTQERILNPFFVTRNTGLKLGGQLAGDRMTWAAGAFNDWLETGENLNNNASDYVGRLTGLPWVTRTTPATCIWELECGMPVPTTERCASPGVRHRTWLTSISIR